MPRALTLRTAALVYLAGLVVHTADHLRRGLDVLTRPVLWLGNASTVLGLVTVVLVLTHHRWAPAFATAVGAAAAVGVSAVHLLPRWGELSDAFTGTRRGAGVSALSWTVVLVEIAGAALMAATGYREWRASLPTPA